jgi:hypothetical protein
MGISRIWCGLSSSRCSLERIGWRGPLHPVSGMHRASCWAPTLSSNGRDTYHAPMVSDAGGSVRWVDFIIWCLCSEPSEGTNGSLSHRGFINRPWPGFAHSLGSLTDRYTLWAYSTPSHSSSSCVNHPLWHWEWSKCICIEFEHLVALEIMLAVGLLFTLGGCRHLDGLEKRDHWAEGGDCLWLRLVILWGVLVLIPCRSTKSNSSKLLYDIECSHLCWFLWHPSIGLGVVPISAWTT